MTHAVSVSPAVRLVVATAAALTLLAGAAFAQQAPSPGKPVVRSQADLPRHTYELPTPTASALLSDPGFATLADQVRRDVEQLLASYTIEDRATLRDLYGTLESLALLAGDHEAALRHVATVRELQDKPAERFTSGLITEAVVAAERAGGDAADRLVALRAAFAAAVAALPWDVVQERIEEIKGGLEIYGRNLFVGLVQSQYDPAASESGRISGEAARALIEMRKAIDRVLPYREPLVEVLQAHIDRHRAEKPDIWTEREVAFPGAKGLHPVVIGIWDSGVDTSIFGEQLFRNEAETFDGRDDDGNGFVDDVHGIAYGLWGGAPTPELLYPLDEAARQRLPEMRDLVKGFFDLRANVDSPQARAVKGRFAAMQPAEVQPMMEDFLRFALFVHGTHVAGIAVAGNPVARILVVRETWPFELVPPPITREVAVRWGANMERTVGYLQRHGARVVNMSWEVTTKEIERMYETNGIGASAEERHRLAREAFDILSGGMRRAMESAPGILFVPAAGNSDEDVSFAVGMPASFTLPNVLAVGAVDRAGDETAFTSYGETVRAHANGFEVESFVPGGERLPFSGTSMAAPHVVNLAAKLFALDPSLTPEEVVGLILDGATRTEDRRRVLIHPKRSMELLRLRDASPGRSSRSEANLSEGAGREHSSVDDEQSPGAAASPGSAR
jgi:hypothetical protein